MLLDTSRENTHLVLSQAQLKKASICKWGFLEKKRQSFPEKLKFQASCQMLIFTGILLIFKKNLFSSWKI